MLVAVAPTWADALTGVGTVVLALGVLIAVYQLGELKRDRHLQWISEMSRRWNEEKLEASRIALREYDSSTVAKKVGRWLRGEGEDETEMTVLLRLPDFFEDVALGVERGRIEIAVVWEALSGPVSKWWEFWEEAVVVFRQTDAPTYHPDAAAFSQFQRLARDLAAYEEARRRPERPGSGSYWAGNRA
jgi:hypothetical protein